MACPRECQEQIIRLQLAIEQLTTALRHAEARTTQVEGAVSKLQRQYSDLARLYGAADVVAPRLIAAGTVNSNGERAFSFGGGTLTRLPGAQHQYKLAFDNTPFKDRVENAVVLATAHFEGGSGQQTTISAGNDSVDPRNGIVFDCERPVPFRYAVFLDSLTVDKATSADKPLS